MQCLSVFAQCLRSVYQCLHSVYQCLRSVYRCLTLRIYCVFTGVFSLCLEMVIHHLRRCVVLQVSVGFRLAKSAEYTCFRAHRLRSRPTQTLINTAVSVYQCLRSVCAAFISVCAVVISVCAAFISVYQRLRSVYQCLRSVYQCLRSVYQYGAVGCASVFVSGGDVVTIINVLSRIRPILQPNGCSLT